MCIRDSWKRPHLRFQRLTRKGEEMKQGIFTVTANEKLTEGVMRMVLTGDTADIAGPGQFVNIKLNGLFLRRPISVCDRTGDRLTIIYKIVGKGTCLLYTSRCV